MPIVPRYSDSRVKLGGIGNAYRSDAGASADSFGGQQARQLGQLAHGVQQVGAQAQNIAMKEIRLQDQKAIMDADNRLSDVTRTLLHDPKSGYYTRRGVHAKGLTTEAAKKLEELKRDAMRGLNARQQAKYRQVWQRRRSGLLDSVSRHEAAETRRADMAKYSSAIKGAHEDAKKNAGNPALVYIAMDKGVAAIRANPDGLPKPVIDQRIAAFKSAIAKTVTLQNSRHSVRVTRKTRSIGSPATGSPAAGAPKDNAKATTPPQDGSTNNGRERGGLGRPGPTRARAARLRNKTLKEQTGNRQAIDGKKRGSGGSGDDGRRAQNHTGTVSPTAHNSPDNGSPDNSSPDNRNMIADPTISPAGFQVSSPLHDAFAAYRPMMTPADRDQVTDYIGHVNRSAIATRLADDAERLRTTGQLANDRAITTFVDTETAGDPALRPVALRVVQQRLAARQKADHDQRKAHRENSFDMAHAGRIDVEAPYMGLSADAYQSLTPAERQQVQRIATRRQAGDPIGNDRTVNDRLTALMVDDPARFRATDLSIYKGRLTPERYQHFVRAQARVEKDAQDPLFRARQDFLRHRLYMMADIPTDGRATAEQAQLRAHYLDRVGTAVSNWEQQHKRRIDRKNLQEIADMVLTPLLRGNGDRDTAPLDDQPVTGSATAPVPARNTGPTRLIDPVSGKAIALSAAQRRRLVAAFTAATGKPAAAMTNADLFQHYLTDRYRQSV